MNSAATPRRSRGFTLSELLTALVVLVVLAAIAVPLWRNHLLRVRRSDATAALIAVQNAQDQYFGRNARYADGAQLTAAAPGGLGLKETSTHGFYHLEVHASADGLGFGAIARIIPQAGQAQDERCVQFSIDHIGLTRAVDAAGTDRSADCWR
jgi:type IV pilus assembly protein PilE